MFEFGAFSEILIILVAALILIGPKELHRILYQCGRWLQKIRHLSQQMRQGLDHYVHEGMFDEYAETQNKKQLKAKRKQSPIQKPVIKRTSKKNQDERKRR